MDVTDLQEQLADRAWLHDDPHAYLAGVHDDLAVVTVQLESPTEPEGSRGLRGA